MGSLILCKDLPKIKELFRLSAGETEKANASTKVLRTLERDYEQTRLNGRKDPALEKKIEKVRREADEHIEAARQYRQKAWDDYHGKDILPITEQTLDPEYQKKLDGNYETGINLGKMTRNEMRLLRRDMQMIFQDPAASLDPRRPSESPLRKCS